MPFWEKFMWGAQTKSSDKTNQKKFMDARRKVSLLQPWQGSTHSVYPVNPFLPTLAKKFYD